MSEFKQYPDSSLVPRPPPAFYDCMKKSGEPPDRVSTQFYNVQTDRQTDGQTYLLGALKHLLEVDDTRITECLQDSHLCPQL